MTMSSSVDAAILAVILALAFESLRRVTFYHQPLQTVVFILLCVGAFGKLAHSLEGAPTPWWAIAMHAGFMIYAVRQFGAAAWSWPHGKSSRSPLHRNPELVGQAQGSRQRRDSE
jgi:hypothetical protein